MKLDPKLRELSDLRDDELECLLREADRAALLGGEFLIAGTWRGGDAALLKSRLPSVRLTVLDSFRGTAAPTAEDAGTDIEGGWFDQGGVKNWKRTMRDAGATLPDEVRELWITEKSVAKIPSRPLSLIWCDVDHYEPTLAVMRRFWDDLVPGGKLLVHDKLWGLAPGVGRACERFADERGLGTWKILVRSPFGVCGLEKGRE